jgi:hypothetical protein
MPKLNDLQSILLACASQRESGSLHPVPDSVADAGVRLTKAMSALMKAGFVEERETSDSNAICRADGDLSFGAFITAAGCTAIGVSEPGEATTPAVLTVADTASRTSKTAAVLILLQREAGATMPELIEATSWLPHTTRAALTGLRKKGHAITRGKRDDVTCYTLAEPAQA